MNKIRAYTMMEMIVVMIVGVIVIGIAYKTYDMVLQHLISRQRNNQKVAALVLFNTQLVCDFGDCDYVLRNQEGFVCHYKTYNVQYSISDKQIVRFQSARTDSLFIAIEDPIY